MTRREAILEAAVGLFSERGFAGTPTAEVASRAGVAEGTIFHHFKTKEGLLREVLADLLDRYLEGAVEEVRRGGTGLEGLERLIRFHFRFTRHHAAESRVVLRDVPADLSAPDNPSAEDVLRRLRHLVMLLEECVERGRADGSVKAVPVRKTALVLHGMLSGLSRQVLLGPLGAPDLAETAVEFCRRSLAAAPGGAGTGATASADGRGKE